MVTTKILWVVFVCMIAVCWHQAVSDETLDLAKAILNREITPEISATLPYRDCSTPQRTFLGWLRSTMEVDMRAYVFYLTPRARKEEIGDEREDALTEKRCQEVSEGIRQAGFSQFKIESFECSTNGSPVKIKSITSAVRGKLLGKESIECTIVEANGQWKIDSIIIKDLEKKLIAP